MSCGHMLCGPEPMSCGTIIVVIIGTSPRDHQKHVPFCIHANPKSYDCNPRKCCWKRGRGCLMKNYASSSSVGAVILWVLFALLLLGGGGFGGWFALKINKRKNKGEAAEESDDE